MVNIESMDELKFTKDVAVRSTPKLQLDFKQSVLAVSLSETARYDGKPPMMENVTAALWQWFASLSREEAEGWLQVQFPKLESYMLTGAAKQGQPSSAKTSTRIEGANGQKGREGKRRGVG